VTRQQQFDVALAIAVLALGLSAPEARDESLEIVFGTAMALPLVLRRAQPLGVLGIVVAASVGYGLVDAESFEAGTFFGAEPIALYSAAAYRPPQVAAPAAAMAIAALLIPAAYSEGGGISGNVFGLTTTMGAVALLGAYVRVRREQTATELAQSNRRAQEVVAAERARIARELHDVVAHSVTVMSAQVGAARLVLIQQPERAAEALTAAERAGRQAIGELRRMLGLLREDGHVASRSPQPSMRELPTLVEQLREVGLEVEVPAEPPSDLPPGLDLTAYRVAQEALTNVLKHAPHAGRATLDVRWQHDGLHVVVSNPGPIDHPLSEHGHGVIGMRERTALYGGRLQAGPQRGGGWRLHAVFPAARPEHGAT
jgi:signal transduction histidine kinase